MPPENTGYIHDVDQLVASSNLNHVLTHYGLQAPQNATGEHRMHCVFNEACIDSTYGNLTVRIDDPVNRIYCHSCGVRGNLLTLIHGLERRTPPSSGRLRGDEFKSAITQLQSISRQVTSDNPQSEDPKKTAEPEHRRSRNQPLHRHEKEAARKLADLYRDLVTDPANMSAAAGQYVRSRPWLTSEMMEKWRVGWIPGNGRSLFRKNYLVYTHRNERGEVVSYSGRDLNFTSRWQKWQQNGRPEGKKPSKHRYVAGYHRGDELYGGHVDRLIEPHVRPSLDRFGLVVTEGMNNVLRLEALQVAAVGITSNRATEEQVRKLIRFARSVANNQILLLPDCEDEGESGFKDLLWRLVENGIDVRLGMSCSMWNGQFQGRQPEDLTVNEWQQIAATSQRRT